MTDHTPGTWISMDGTGVFGDGIIALSDEGAGMTPIALPPFAPDGENWEADARLIAAAPDLLAACGAALHAIQRVADETNVAELFEAQDACFHAIGRAKGQVVAPATSSVGVNSIVTDTNDPFSAIPLDILAGGMAEGGDQ